ncbi:hypothetical protein C8Q76DRAFT_716150 [Earliella scabrosa]|nr:hypothetical protein C8Q76DRAFT_716150 [Earliella scabrosa]
MLHVVRRIPFRLSQRCNRARRFALQHFSKRSRRRGWRLCAIHRLRVSICAWL